VSSRDRNAMNESGQGKKDQMTHGTRLCRINSMRGGGVPGLLSFRPTLHRGVWRAFWKWEDALDERFGEKTRGINREEGSGAVSGIRIALHAGRGWRQ